MLSGSGAAHDLPLFVVFRLLHETPVCQVRT
jgi:hypothetical protein